MRPLAMVQMCQPCPKGWEGKAQGGGQQTNCTEIRVVLYGWMDRVCTFDRYRGSKDAANYIEDADAVSTCNMQLHTIHAVHPSPAPCTHTLHTVEDIRGCGGLQIGERWH